MVLYMMSDKAISVELQYGERECESEVRLVFAVVTELNLKSLVKSNINPSNR